MMEYHSLTDVWDYFDDIERKNFLSSDIVIAINGLPESILSSDNCRYESLAFNFSENSSNRHWNLYYGPQFTFIKNDTQEEVCIPSLNDITPEIIEYWEGRSQVVKNPLLKMRYTGLVFVFKKKLFNVEPDYRSIKLGHINALFEVVNGDYCHHKSIILGYAERALELSIGFNNRELQDKSVDVFYNAHKRYLQNDMHPGIWGRIMQSLIKHRPYFAKYEDEIIQEQLDRYERLKELALAEGSVTDKYAHILSDQVDLLADYYHSLGANDKVEPLLERLLAAIKLSINARGGLWGQGMLQRMQDRYRKYGFDKMANRLFVDLSDLGELTLNEMHPVSVSVPLDKGLIDAFFDDALSGTVREILLYYMSYYIPSYKNEIIRMKEKAKQTPLLDMISMMTIDSSGSAISKVGVGPDAERQKLSHSMYENMRYTAFFMHLHVMKMKENEIMTKDNLLEILETSPLISNDRKNIVERGIQAYIDEDYLVSCHLLVPQLEAAIRRLFALNGVSIMRQKLNPIEGSEYISLDTLLSSEDAISFMGKDIANYLRNLLTDQYGWNIRNQLSHGLLGTSSFNSVMADRVVHAFMLLGIFKLQETQNLEQDS